MSAEMNALLVQRAKQRAIDAAEDAISLMRENRLDEARGLLDESHRHIDTAEQRHKDGAR